MIYKKSVVLTSTNGGKQKGVITLEYDAGETYGNVRLYNFDKEPEGILSLGILNNNKVYKAGLTRENDNFYTFKIAGKKDINAFSCAVVNFVNGEAKPLLMGATNGAVTSEERLCNSLSILDGDMKCDVVEGELNQNQIYLEDQDEIEELINSQTTCDNKCNECKYRDAFFKLGDDVSEPEIKEESFFDDIKEQIDTLFNKYPEEEILKEIIPDSKWVKIDYEDKGEYYVVGLMYEDGRVKYVCYGVPSMYKEEPPKELRGFCTWLPLDTTKQEGFGYWITYQDAVSGENVTIDYKTV